MLTYAASEQGCSYAFTKHGGHIPAFEVPAVDTTGAGDGFTAGFLHKLIEVTDEWQAEEKEVDGFEGLMPRGHQACFFGLLLSLLALLVQRLRLLLPRGHQACVRAEGLID